MVEATTWLLAIGAILGLAGGAWKLMYDAAASRRAPRPKRPWELT
jgi:hypothetical protein